jgi:D-alanine-D-alanine ligase
MSKHVAVLMGGWSAEREVSLSTGAECATALRQAGYRVTEVDVGRDVPLVLAKLKPDVCFNGLHGPIGEDGNIQGMLNVMGIPYTHSGLQASALAMDKPASLNIFMRAEIKCPTGAVISREDALSNTPMEPPYVIKPTDQGSSVGVHIVHPGDNYRPFVEEWSFGERVLVERFIPGRELTVAVLDGEPFCVTEITSDRGFYDYDAKYAEGGSRHLLPAPLPATITQQALDTAAQAHVLLGCRGVTRSDFRYDDTEQDPGDLYLLELNTQPGMTPTSLVPEQAAHCGMGFPELVSRLVEDARCDF